MKILRVGAKRDHGQYELADKTPDRIYFDRDGNLSIQVKNIEDGDSTHHYEVVLSQADIGKIIAKYVERTLS